MLNKLTCLGLCIALAVLIAAHPSTNFAAEPNHTIVAADAVKWQAGPPALPPGAQSAVLYGDPAKEGLFAMRLKLPKGYHIPPHTHSKPEVVTIISGIGRLGMGETANEEKTESLSTGSFIALPPGMAHYVYTDEESVVQLNSIGPWEVNYVNPKDDPRKKTQ
jgi:quercetin dioxygenase-like cupin family protein